MEDAGDILRQGNAILETVLSPAGFHFEGIATGHSSGGHFASGAWWRDDRAIELHFRHSLGLVTYRIGGTKMGHADLMRALNVTAQSAYPGFSGDPLDGFRHLRNDLERFGGGFLSGQLSETDLQHMRAEIEHLPKRRLP